MLLSTCSSSRAGKWIAIFNGSRGSWVSACWPMTHHYFIWIHQPGKSQWNIERRSQQILTEVGGHSGLYPAICFTGEYETVRGDDRVATSPRAERGRGCPPPQGSGSGSVTPGKILKFETQFGSVWCILARNWRFSSIPPLWMKTLP